MLVCRLPHLITFVTLLPAICVTLRFARTLLRLRLRLVDCASPLQVSWLLRPPAHTVCTPRFRITGYLRALVRLRTPHCARTLPSWLRLLPRTVCTLTRLGCLYARLRGLVLAVTHAHPFCLDCLRYPIQFLPACRLYGCVAARDAAFGRGCSQFAAPDSRIVTTRGYTLVVLLPHLLPVGYPHGAPLRRRYWYLTTRFA